MLFDHIFRAYDIRGIYQKDLNEDTAKLIGKGYGTYLIKNVEPPAPPFQGGKSLKVVIGRDNRTHGESLQSALIEGIRSTGINVTNIGLATSPLLYFSICQGDFDGGINVTASHNPKEFNGFKLQGKMAHSICGDKIQDILEIIKKEDFEEGIGSLSENNYFEDYLKKINQISSIS